MKNILGGFAGAIALNLLHESYRQVDKDAPHVELVGEEALSKIISKAGETPPRGDALYAATLAADMFSNSLYYSLIGVGNKKNIMLRGAVYGIAAGVGAVTLTKPLGLHDAPVTRTTKTKVLTVSWYLIGALVTAATIRALNK